MCSKLITIHNVTLWTCPNEITPGKTLTPFSPSPVSLSPVSSLSPSPFSPSPNSPSPFTPSPNSPSPNSLTPDSPSFEGLPTEADYPIPTTPSSKLPINTTSCEVCECRMDGLHALWIVPVLLLIAILVLRCQSSGYRIANTPAGRYLSRRSHSWPIIDQLSSIELPTRAHTEPTFAAIVV